jgi:hypothetical protein
LIPEGKGKTDLEWTIYYAKQVPGPDAYNLPSMSDGLKTGKFSTADPPTYLDRIMTEAARTPGPNDYEIQELDSIVNRPGGNFSTSNPKGYIELEEYRSRSIPGPGTYTPKMSQPSGGTFSEARPKSNLDWVVYYSKSKPGPGAHRVRGKTRYDSKPTSGGKFSKSVQKSFIQLEEERVSDHPSPCDYDLIKFPRGASPKRTKRRLKKYCSSDGLMRQIATLDQMSRSRTRKKKRTKKKKSSVHDFDESKVLKTPGMSAISLMNEDRLLPTDLEDTPVRTKQLMKYKVMKLDDIYEKYK